MMNLVACALVALASAGSSAQGSAPAPVASSALEDSLIALEKESWVAWQKRDGAFYQTFLSDDHVEISTGGVSTKAEIVAFVGSPACVVKSWAVSQFSFALFNANTALLTYRAEQETVCRGPVPSPAWVSSLYVRRGGRWQNAVYQQTPIPQPSK